MRNSETIFNKVAIAFIMLWVAAQITSAYGLFDWEYSRACAQASAFWTVLGTIIEIGAVVCFVIRAKFSDSDGWIFAGAAALMLAVPTFFGFYWPIH